MKATTSSALWSQEEFLQNSAYLMEGRNLSLTSNSDAQPTFVYTDSLCG